MLPVILVVEDEALLARNIRTYFERRGYEVALAGTLRAAFSLYDEIHPDAVLLDQNLPDGVGMDLIDAIRKSDRVTKLVVMTTSARRRTRPPSPAPLSASRSAASPRSSRTATSIGATRRSPGSSPPSTCRR
jgi:CheY-like chemotaxis protein